MGRFWHRRNANEQGRKMIAKLAANVGKGLFAGLVGTAAMTVSSTLEAKVRDRGASDAPVQAMSKVVGIESFTSDEAKERFSQAVHWGYGTQWGAVRGILGTLLPPAAADAAHFGVVWGTEMVTLPALDVAPPATEWGAKEIAIDVLHHAVYAAATGVAFRWLSRD